MKRSRIPSQKFKFLWRVYADRALSASAKCVMTALLLVFHNNKTGQCNPGASAIAAIVGRNRRNVFPALDELKAGGWLTFAGTKGGSKRNTNQFRFDFSYTGPVTPASPVGVTPTPPVMSTDQRVTPTPHEPLKNHSSLRDEGVCGDSAMANAPCGASHEEKFEELVAIWRARPYGVGPKKPRAAFYAVCDGEDHPEDVIASAARWVAAVESRYLPLVDGRRMAKVAAGRQYSAAQWKAQRCRRCHGYLPGRIRARGCAMTKNLTVVNNGALTQAVAPPFKAYNQLKEMLDRIERQCTDIGRHVRNFEKHPAGRYGCDDFLKWSQDSLANFDKFGPDRIAQAEAALAALNPESAYDENGELKKIWVAAKVGELVGSFPQANAANPEIYVPMLINEIMADGYIGVIELEMTVRAVRQTSKFLPAISEVLTAKREVTEEWTERFDALENLAWQADELRRLIEEAKPIRLEDDERRAAMKLAEDDRRAALRLEEERRAAREAERKLPIKAGDRVHEAIAGPCTVTDVIFDTEYQQIVCLIEPDSWCADEGYLSVPPNLLSKLIAGDTCFERPVTKEDEKL